MLNILPLLLVVANGVFASVQTPDPEEKPTAEKPRVIIEITNIRDADGKIGIGVYTSQENFEKEVELFSRSFSKSGMKDGSLTTEVSLAPGTYGIALLDDEDSDGEMDYGLMLPDEGFGFSNYYHSGLSRPDFEDFNFEVGSETMKVKIKVKYM